MSVTGGKNSSLLQKKSVFTIAYDEMATKEILPNSSESNQEEWNIWKNEINLYVFAICLWRESSNHQKLGAKVKFKP